MSRRRLVMGAILFVLAAVVLVAMNRYSSFFASRTKTRPSSAAASGAPFAYELYSPKDGRHNGRITAVKYEVLPDGTIDCRDVSANILATAFGDVTLTGDRAMVKLDQVSRSFGKITLEGNVIVHAVKGGVATLSGRFDKITYDAKSKDVNAEGPVELNYAQGLTVTGTGLDGNTDKMHFAVQHDVNVAVKAGEGRDASLAQPGLNALPRDLKIVSGGPLVYDSASSTVSFANGVVADGTGLHLTGSHMTLVFDRAASASGGQAEGWKATAMNLDGPAEIDASLQKGQMKVTGSRIEWKASPWHAHVIGSPGRSALGDDFIEAPDVTVEIGANDQVVAMDANGPGKARVSVREGMFAGPLPAPRSSGAKAAIESTVPSRAAAATNNEPISVAWQDSMHYDAKGGMMVLASGVGLVRGDSRMDAAKVSMSVSSSDARVTAIDAEGNVVFTEGDRRVTGDSGVYDAATDAMTIRGNPVALSMPGGGMTTRLLTYSPGKKTMLAERACEIDLPAVKSGAAGAVRTPIHVSSPRVRGDLSGPTTTFTCDGGVVVTSTDSRLTCDTITLSGAPAGLADGVAAPAAKDSPVRIDGQGNVVFARDATFNAKGDRFTFTQVDGKVRLMADLGRRVQMDYGNGGTGDSATIWADAVEAGIDSTEARCSKPEVFLSTKGMLLGFPGETVARGKAGAAAERVTKLYIDSSGEMIARKTSDSKGTLSFTGGVKGVARNESASTRDEITAQTLVLDLDSLSPPAAAKPAATSQPKVRVAAAQAPQRKMDVTAAQASGGVTLKYTGPDKTLYGQGDSFDWVKANDTGRLRGSPAKVWSVGSQPAASVATEFVYIFTEDRVIVNGGGAGSVLFRRKPKAK